MLEKMKVVCMYVTPKQFIWKTKYPSGSFEYKWLVVCSSIINSILRIFLVCNLLLFQRGGTENCEWWSRSDGSACAHACLDSYIGRCPRKIVTFFGRLKNEPCRSTEYASVMPVVAGPCGVIQFIRYDSPPSQIIRHKKLNVTPSLQGIWLTRCTVGALQLHK